MISRYMDYGCCLDYECQCSLVVLHRSRLMGQGVARPHAVAGDGWPGVAPNTSAWSGSGYC